MVGTLGAPLKSILKQASQFRKDFNESGSIAENMDNAPVAKGSEKDTQLVVFDPGVSDREETAFEDNLKQLNAAEEYKITKDDSLTLADTGFISRTRKRNQTKHGTSRNS